MTGRFMVTARSAAYCGLGGSAAAGAGLEVAGKGVAVGTALFEVAGTDWDFGRSGTVVIALSGFSR